MSEIEIPLICKFCEMKDMLNIDCLESEDIINHCPHRKAMEENEKMRDKLQEMKV